MTITANQDLYVRWDKSKPRLIAKAGDQLTIIHDGGTALVVKNKNGEAFSVETIKTDYKNAY